MPLAPTISGTELDQVSALDFDNYDDTGVNWRVVEGYGTTIAACGENLPAVLSCPVSRIEHHDKRLKIETSQGVIVADQAIVTLPTTVLAENDALFAPSLPERPRPLRDCRWALPTSYFYPRQMRRSLKRTAACSGRSSGQRPQLIIFDLSDARKSKPISEASWRASSKQETSGRSSTSRFRS